MKVSQARPLPLNPLQVICPHSPILPLYRGSKNTPTPGFPLCSAQATPQCTSRTFFTHRQHTKKGSFVIRSCHKNKTLLLIGCCHGQPCPVMTAITTSVKRLLLPDLQTFLKHNVIDGLILRPKRLQGFLETICMLSN